MSIIGSVSGLFNRPLPSTLETAKTDLSQFTSPGANALGGAGSSASPLGTPATSGAAAISNLGGAPNTAFGSMFDKFVNGVDTKMKTADVEKSKILTGESTNLHQAMIAMQEAGTSFSLMIEVRNKLVDSYQELMRMQV